MNFIYIRQPEPLGLGHAVLCAQPVVGDEPFGVILADDLVYAQTPALKQLTDARERMGGGSVLAVQDVPHDQTNKYGIVGVEDALCATSRVHSIVEKPQPADAPSDMAVIGRYVLEPEIFETLRRIPRGVGGEIQLTDAIAARLRMRTPTRTALKVRGLTAAASRAFCRRPCTTRALRAIRFKKSGLFSEAPWWSAGSQT